MLNERLVLLTRQSLRQAVCCYVRSRDPFDIDPSFTNFLAEPVVMYIDVLKLSVKLSVAFSYELNTIEGSYLKLLLARCLPSKASFWWLS